MPRSHLRNDGSGDPRDHWYPLLHIPTIVPPIDDTQLKLTDVAERSENPSPADHSSLSALCVL
jgi:hypothetical protein